MSHGPTLAALVLSWWIMMSATMLPSTWPWLRALHGLGAPGPSGSPTSAHVPAFASGYLLVWLGFSVAAALLQRFAGTLAHPGPEVRGALLATAGLYQLTPVKLACLRHCRSPLAVVLARWPITDSGALRLGLEHGLFCLGCCWALMLLGMAAGAAGWLWMSGLALLVAVEKLSPSGPRVARWMGAGLVGLALLVAAGRL